MFRLNSHRPVVRLTFFRVLYGLALPDRGGSLISLTTDGHSQAELEIRNPKPEIRNKSEPRIDTDGHG
jgi:hypothetical protein